jgi:hypothetical protein
MGYDKYGLNWKVWGQNASAPEKKENPLIPKTSANDTKQPQKKIAQDDEPEKTKPAPQTNPSLKFKNAKFLSDSNTAFNNPCKVQIEYDGTDKFSGSVKFFLWAKYENKDYDLNSQVSATFKDNIATAELKLFYVEKHYHDLVVEKIQDAKVDYYFKAEIKNAKPVTSEKLTMPTANNTVDRYIIFEETAEKADASLGYEFSKAEPAKKRWIYVFLSEDKQVVNRVLEIRTNSAGNQFSTWELTEENYAKRPDLHPFEDVAFVPTQSDSGAKYQTLACISEFRLPSSRIFDKQTGIVADPKKRCSDSSDNSQVTYRLNDDETENVVLTNWLRYAESERKRFNPAYVKWEDVRRASWIETDEQIKKEKFTYEFGALLLRIFDAFPDYKRQLKAGKYPEIYEVVKAKDAEKSKITNEVLYRVKKLCSIIAGQKFIALCQDFISTIHKSDDQKPHWYDFENRIGELFDGLARFKDGIDLITKLLPEVKDATENTWLQDLLLLKNDVWQFKEEHLASSKSTVSGSKLFQHGRKVGDGLVKVLLEAAKAGASCYKPSEMAAIIEKVAKTVGVQIKCIFEKKPLETTDIKPFREMFDRSEDSFWFVKIKPEGYKESGLIKGTKKFLLVLEGLAMYYSIQDWCEKVEHDKANLVDSANLGLKFGTYLLKSGLIKFLSEKEGKLVLTKLGDGPIAALNLVTSFIDGYMAAMKAVEEKLTHDYDAAICNYIAAAGFFISFAGSGVILSTCFAGAALASSTGIGLAPGILLGVIGTVFAVTGQLGAAYMNNTPIEDLLLKTPWGIAPEKELNQINSEELEKQYLTMMRILNSFRVTIDMNALKATVYLRTLEPETMVTIHKIIYGVPSSADGSSMATSVIAQNITLTDKSCLIARTKESVNLTFDLPKDNLEVNNFLANCRKYYGNNSNSAKPEYICLEISVDLYGDKGMVLPDLNKRVIAEKYFGSHEHLKVR